jgi:chemotaxis protein CheD
MVEGRVVGIAEFKTARSPECLSAYGLGSCVGVTLYDPGKRIGGFAHVMLPSSRLHTEITVPGKYADTALEALLVELKRDGAHLKDLEAKLVGGANMFEAIAQHAVPVGLRNVSAVREKLQEHSIPVIAEDVGGTRGRTVVFHLEDGRIEVKKLNQESHWF